MRKLYIPYAHAKSIYDIDVSFFKKENVTTLLLDLDNTLDSYRQKVPTPKALELKENLLNSTIEVNIIQSVYGKKRFNSLYLL